MRRLEGTRVLVVGLGRSGEAAATFLAARGARVSATDAKAESALGNVAEKLRSLGVGLHLGAPDPGVFLNQDLIVVSPGVP